jgi:hypothetical protein
MRCHLHGALRSFLGNIRHILGTRRSKICRFFSFSKAQSNQGFPSRLFIRDPHAKIPRRIHDGFDVVFQRVSFFHNVNGTQGKEFGFGTGFVVLCICENKQDGIAAAFDPQGTTLQWFGQGPEFGAADGVERQGED